MINENESYTMSRKQDEEKETKKKSLPNNKQYETLTVGQSTINLYKLFDLIFETINCFFFSFD